MKDDYFGSGVVAGVILSVFVVVVAVVPICEHTGYSKAIDNVKAYGADRVIAKFNRDNGIMTKTDETRD